MARVCAGALILLAGGASFGVAVANPPVEGFQPEGGPYVPARGLSETAYFVMMMGGVALAIGGLVAIYVALIRRSDGLH